MASSVKTAGNPLSKSLESIAIAYLTSVFNGEDVRRVLGLPVPECKEG
jgi:hypothetical protein